MRLYSFRLFPDDGKLHSCLRSSNQLPLSLGKSRNLKRDKDGLIRAESVQPYQAATFAEVNGGTDRVNITYLQVISGYVFCTPRCYTTKGWEIGICNSYQVKYLYGGESPTTFDMHLLMAMEIIQVYLQQIEIRDQSVGYFYLPDDLRQSFKKPRIADTIPVSCRKLWELLESLHCKDTDMSMSITAQLAQLNLIRREYFNDLHLEVDLSKKSNHRLFLKILGCLFGQVKGLLKSKNIKLRQYYGHCPFQRKVRTFL